MAKKYKVIYNPLAASGTNDMEKVSRINAFYGKENTEFFDITKMPPYDEFKKTLDDDSVIVLSGGDGTLNRFINESDGILNDHDIYYFAAGSGNDFLNDLDVEDKSFPVRINQYLVDLPIIHVKGKTLKFLNAIGYGIDGYCCVEGERQREKSDKPINYTTIAIKGILGKYSPRNAKITVDGETKEYKNIWLAPTMHGRYFGGGMMAVPDQVRGNADRTLSVMTYCGKNRIAMLALFPKIFTGEHVKKTSIVTVRKGHVIHVEYDRPTPLQVDGEVFNDVTEYTAEWH